MTASTGEIVLTIFFMSFWFLFPIGIFLSVSHVDKNTDQIIRLKSLRHSPEGEVAQKTIRFGSKVKKPTWRPHAAFLDIHKWRHH